jgi:hypothetical protein
MTQQQVFISHACSRLGFRRLSSQWLLKAFDDIDELGLSNFQEDAKMALHIISATEGVRRHQKETHSPFLVDVFSLYKEETLEVFFEGYRDKPRLFVHLALAALQNGFVCNAKLLLKRTEEICDSAAPPAYYDELLHAINMKIIIQVKEGNTHKAVDNMHRRCDIVSKWVGSTSVELAQDLHRLG